MSTRTVLIPHYNFSSSLYSLSVYQKKGDTNIDMNLFIPHVNTADLPYTVRLLKKNLPSILFSQCFNDDKLPFSEEVQRTEIGHLFEHILLEYLCSEKISQGFKNATYSGVTDWNWIKEKRGTFHITISTGIEERDIFKSALKKTIQLMNRILAPRVAIN